MGTKAEYQIRDYSLADIGLLSSNSRNFNYSVFIPEKLSIVLGKGSDPGRSVIWENVNRDRVDIFRRPSGGETVIVSENTIVIGTVKKGEKFRNPSLYFDRYNDLIIGVLSEFGVKNLSKKGFSDICIGEKKILGSSIYRTGDTVFYHAVLNVAESVETIVKYLEHPVREPEYRNRRRHSEFVTSLRKEGYLIQKQPIIDLIKENLEVLSGS